MGIDLLDITFRLEKQLGRKISHNEFWEKAVESIEVSPDRFATDIRAMRIHELLCELTGTSSNSFFDAESTRHLVMESLQHCFNVPAARLVPETKLEDIVPKEHRRTEWERFAQTIGRPLPELELPGITMTFGCLAVIAAIGCAGIAVALLIEHNAALAVAMLVASVVFTVGCRSLFSSPRRTSFASGCQTIEELVRAMACIDAAGISLQNDIATKSGQSPPHPNPWTADLLWDVLKGVLVNALGVDEEEVVPDALLIRDLGCD